MGGIANEDPNLLDSLQCISRRLLYPLNHFVQQSRFSFLEDSEEDPLKLNVINYFYFFCSIPELTISD